MKELKYVKLPEDHGYDEQHLKFLETLDNALEGAVKGASSKKDIEEVKSDLAKQLAELKSEFNYELMKEQLAELYKKIDPLARVPQTVEQEKAQEREMNAQWVKAFLKRDSVTLKEMQKKTWPSHVLHTGDNANIDSGSEAQGGYLIPELFNAEINRYVEEGGLARREMRYLPFSGAGNERKLHTLLTSVAVSWVDEGETKPKDKPTFAQLTQELKVLAVIVIMTEEIIDDSAVDLVKLCAELIGEAIAIEEDTQFFTGTGAPWTGIINAAGIVTAQMGVGLIGQNVTPNHMLALKYALSTSRRRGGKFYMHPEIWAGIRAYRASAVGDNDQQGNYLVQEPTGGEPAMLWGSPVIETEVLPSFSDTQDPDEPVAIYSNLGKTCVYGDKMGIRVKLLDQATVTDSTGTLVNLAERDMMALRVHKRVGYLPLLPDGIAVLFTGPVS